MCLVTFFQGTFYPKNFPGFVEIILNLHIVSLFELVIFSNSINSANSISFFGHPIAHPGIVFLLRTKRVLGDLFPKLIIMSYLNNTPIYVLKSLT